MALTKDAVEYSTTTPAFAPAFAGVAA
jgi:hypothetical protein